MAEQFLPLSAAFIRNGLRELDAVDFKVLCYILTFWGGRNKYCAPGEARIAKGLALSVSTVKRAIKRLEATGYLSIVRVRGCANTYAPGEGVLVLFKRKPGSHVNRVTRVKPDTTTGFKSEPLTTCT